MIEDRPPEQLEREASGIGRVDQSRDPTLGAFRLGRGLHGVAGGLQLGGGLVERALVGELPAGEREPFPVVGLLHDHPVRPLVDPHEQLVAAGRRHDHRAERLGVAAPRIQIRDVDPDVTQRSHVHAEPPSVCRTWRPTVLHPNPADSPTSERASGRSPVTHSHRRTPCGTLEP